MCTRLMKERKVDLCLSYDFIYFFFILRYVIARIFLNFSCYLFTVTKNNSRLLPTSFHRLPQLIYVDSYNDKHLKSYLVSAKIIRLTEMSKMYSCIYNNAV